MKTLISLSVLILFTNLSCTVYESDSSEYLKENGAYEDNKIVISSTDSYEESFCLADSPNYKEFLSSSVFIFNGEHSSLDTSFDVYKNTEQTKMKVNYAHKSLTYTCLFGLKKPDFSTDNIHFIIGKGLKSFQDATE